LSQGAEVLFPPISAGMKKKNLSSAHRVEAAAVRCFAEIAGTARERQVAYPIKPAQCDRGDVLDFEWEIEDCFRCVAILTPVLGS
jgi:hypothetical protein